MDETVTYHSVSSYDGNPRDTFAGQTDDQLEAALPGAAVCFKTWWATIFARRAAAVARCWPDTRLPGRVRPASHVGDGQAECRDPGEVNLSANILDCYAGSIECFLAPQRLVPASGETLVDGSRLGVLFGMRPRSILYYQLARSDAPDLLAGNIVMGGRCA